MFIDTQDAPQPMVQSMGFHARPARAARKPVARGRRQRKGTDTAAKAPAGTRAIRLERCAGEGFAEASALRQLAWRRLAEARTARDAGDEAACRALLAEVRALRHRAGKVSAFARLCEGRARRLRAAEAATDWLPRPLA